MSANKMKPGLVADTAEKLRELVLGEVDGKQIGSLNEVADTLDVGIVTVQQAARILEHEGLLKVKRGPGGGYYGARPDDSVLERAFATYMRVHNFGYREAFEVTLLLEGDIIEAAASSGSRNVQATIESLLNKLHLCNSVSDQYAFEIEFRESLVKVVNKPLVELLANVAWQLYSGHSQQREPERHIQLEVWKIGRSRILHAIQEQDQQLAIFESQRYRRMVQRWLYGEV